jgi:probable HAF family extracellular repeat protein
MARPLLPVAALLAALMVPQQSITAARPGSNITDLGTLGGDNSEAFGINNDPSVLQVVGQSGTASGAVHAFVWTAPAGPMIDLGTLGGRTSWASDINDHGQIAGRSESEPVAGMTQGWAVVWANIGGTWVTENLGTVTGMCCASAFGINNGTNGDPAAVIVVGNSRVPTEPPEPPGFEFHAVMWTKSGAGWTLRVLGTLPGDTGSNAADVNDHGEIVGSSGSAGVNSAFLWTASNGMRRLPSLSSGNTQASAISNSGDIAGFSTDASGNPHAVRWRAATAWQLEDLGSLGRCCSFADGINNLGDIVGTSNFGRRAGLQHAFLVASTSTGMTDLGAIGGSSVARDLNDFGVVVGAGRTRNSNHALLWRLP